MSRTVNIHEAKTHLSRLLEEVRAGEHIIIAKAGEPVAELTAFRRIDVVFGGMEGEFGPPMTDAEWEESDLELRATFDDALQPDDA